MATLSQHLAAMRCGKSDYFGKALPARIGEGRQAVANYHLIWERVMLNFSFGLLAGAAVSLVLTTPPDKVIERWGAWWRLFS